MITEWIDLALLSCCFLGLAGCAEDNEAAIKQQAPRRRDQSPVLAPPRPRLRKNITRLLPGIQGAGIESGPRTGSRRRLSWPEEVILCYRASPPAKPSLACFRGCIFVFLRA